MHHVLRQADTLHRIIGPMLYHLYTDRLNVGVCLETLSMLSRYCLIFLFWFAYVYYADTLDGL